MLYYEIVRLDTNQPSNRELFDRVDKMVKRGWTGKALEFLAEWDYGGENIDAARANRAFREDILDSPGQGDSILKKDGPYTLCKAHCPSGLYDAYYLVRQISALALASWNNTRQYL